MAGKYDPRLLNPVDVRAEDIQKFFIMIGSGDHGVGSNRRAARDLAAMEVPVKLNVYEGVGHHFPNNYRPELRKAMQFVLAQ